MTTSASCTALTRCTCALILSGLATVDAQMQLSDATWDLNACHMLSVHIFVSNQMPGVTVQK